MAFPSPVPEPSLGAAEPGSGSAAPRPSARRRGAQACVICNKRKIRCRLPENGDPCDNCRAFEYECIPYQRKRKRYSVVSCRDSSTQNQAIVVATTTHHRPNTAQGSASHGNFSNTEVPNPPKPVTPAGISLVQTPQETAEFVQAALTAQFGQNHNTAQHASPLESPSTCSLARSTASLQPRLGADRSPGGRSTSAAYLGRSKYLGEDLEEELEGSVAVDPQGVHASLTADDWAVLHLRRAFDLPCRAVCESLVATFVARCDPWMPVVEPKILEDLLHGKMSDKPLLLLQAVLMAGSRMQTESSILEDASTRDLYNRAKVLFFSGYEKDPLTLVTAVTILQYWNPSGPSHISIHNSGYWLRIGVGLVHQMGLHKEPAPEDPHRAVKRRLFWTLFARDSLLSAGQGRPRAIHLEDCSIRWPDATDFAGSPGARAHLWVAYVKIAGILGDLTQWHLRGCPEGEIKSQSFEEQLRSWIRDLPPELRVCDVEGNMLPYDCNVRFLYLPYFTAISILYKPRLPSGARGSPSQLILGSTIAASCICRIFEDALARNEVRHGVAMQAIYLLIAGICQLGSYDYPLLWRQSTRELNTIILSLRELSKTWQTAEDTLRLIQRLQKRVCSIRPNPNPPPVQVQGLSFDLFEPFGPKFCSKLPVIVENMVENPTFRDMGSSDSGAHERSNMQGLDIETYEAAALSDPESARVEVREGEVDGLNVNLYDIGSPDLMADLLGDLGSETLYNGENWFLQDLC